MTLLCQVKVTVCGLGSFFGSCDVFRALVFVDATQAKRCWPHCVSHCAQPADFLLLGAFKLTRLKRVHKG